jgi:hypothetical protein
MQKRSSLPLIVLVAVVALVIGSFGTATAAGLTAGKVKKIATKVVNKKASSLSVANAASLGGQPASTYLNKAYRYRLPIGAAASSSKTFTFTGLPQGTYLATYAGEFSLSAAGSVGCYLRPVGSSTDGEGASYGTSSSSIALTTGSAVFTVGPAGVQLYCFAVGAITFTVYGGTDARSSVSFTQVNGITDATATRTAGEATEGSIAGH